MKHIGLFFGSFNPIHIGHLSLAEYVMGKFGLDEVEFIVSPSNPLIDKSDINASFKDRFRMVQLAISSNDRFSANDIEQDFSPPNYTYDTIREYMKMHISEDIKLYLIMGADNFMVLDQWKNWKELLKLVTVIVVRRDNSGLDELEDKKIDLYHKMGYRYLDELEQTYDTGILFSSMIKVNMSSTYIRNRLSNSESVRYLVVDDVLNYINKMRLYK